VIPARIIDAGGQDAGGQVPVPHQVADVQNMADVHRFQVDRVVLANERQRRLMLEVRALSAHRLMQLCSFAPRATAFARRVLPCWRRGTRRCALASCCSAFR